MISTGLPLPDPLAALAGLSAAMPAPVLGEDMLPDFSALVAGMMPAVADDMVLAPVPPRMPLPAGRQEAAAALPDDREPAIEEEGADANLLSWFDFPVTPDARTVPEVTAMPVGGVANADMAGIATAPSPMVAASVLRSESAPGLPAPPSSTFSAVGSGVAPPLGKGAAGAPGLAPVVGAPIETSPLTAVAAGASTGSSPIRVVNGGMPLADLIEHPGDIPAPAPRPGVRESVEQRIARLLASTAGPVVTASPKFTPITASAPAPSQGSASTPIVGSTSTPVLALVPMPIVGSAPAPDMSAMPLPVAASMPTPAPAVGSEAAPATGSLLSPIVASRLAPHAGGDRPVVAPQAGADPVVRIEPGVAADLDLPASPISRPAPPVVADRIVDPEPRVASHVDLPAPPVSRPVDGPAPVAALRASAATAHAPLLVSASVWTGVSTPAAAIPNVSQAGVEPPRMEATEKSAGPVEPRPVVGPVTPAPVAAQIVTDTAMAPGAEAAAPTRAGAGGEPVLRPDAIVRPSPAPDIQRVVAPVAETAAPTVAPVPAPAVPVSATPVAAALAPMTLPTLDAARADWIDALVERIEIVRAADGLRHVQMKLAPDALGAIDVRVEQGPRGEIAVHVEAQTPQGRAAMADAAPRLAEMVEARGLKLAESGIDAGRGGTGGDRRQPQAEPRQPDRPARSQTTDTEASAAADRLA